MIGRTISHYTILERIGAGGMGEVYLAHDARLDRRVALKFLPESLRDDAVARERFLREARAASRLSHPGIVGIHAVEEVGGQAFIAMEYVAGRSLRRVLQEGDLALDRAIAIAAEVASALSAAHAAGIVHRDLKPENIVITDEGRAKVLDFGVAKVEGATKLTETAAQVGTIAYMSPEQAQREAVDARSDLFSLGAVLYETIAGRPPFGGEHPVAVIYSIANDEPEPLARYKSGVSQELERIVGKALRKDREKRYQTAADLAADLLALEPAPSRTAPRTSRARRPLVPLAALAAVLLAGASLALPSVRSWIFRTARVRTPSLAVLQFRNFGAPGDDDYLAAGLTDEVITTLAGVPGLRVTSRTAVDRYHGRPVDPRRVGRELGVGYVLEGSIQHSGGALRVTAQLIQTADGFHVWAKTFDGSMADIFAMQDSLAARIAGALRPVVGIKRTKIPQRWTANPEAYVDFLRGREIYFEMGASVDLPDRVAAATRWYQQAIALDPNYAPAIAGLADILVFRWGQGHRVAGALDRAVSLARRAQALDPNLAIALRAEARAWRWKGDRKRARGILERAVALNPSLGITYYTLSVIYAELGFTERGLETALRGLRADPDEMRLYKAAATRYSELGRYEDAEQMVAKGLDRFPDAPLLLVERANFLGRAHRHDEQLRTLERLASLEPTWTSFQRIANCLQSLHRPAASDSVFRLIADRWPNLAGALTAVGRRERSAGRLASAESLFVRAVRIDPDYYFARVNLAHVLAEEGRTKEAERAAMDLAARWPDDAAVCANIAWFYRLNLGQFDKAEVWARRATRLNPQSEPAQQELSRAYFAQGRYQRAADGFQAAIRLRPDSYWNYRAMAQALYQAGRIRESIRAAQRSVDLKADDVSGLMILGVDYSASGDRYHAAVIFERIMAIDSTSSAAINNLAAIYSEEGQTRKAREEFLRAARADTTSWVPWVNVASLSLDLGDLGVAEGAARTAILRARNNREGDATGYFLLGRVEELRGSADSARADFRNGLAWIEPALRARPDNESIMGVAGRLYAKTGEIGRARGLAERLARNQKESTDALYAAACIMALAGDKPHALDYLESAAAAGYDGGRAMAIDNELETLHGEPRFKKLVASLQ